MSKFTIDPPVSISTSDARKLVEGAEDLARRVSRQERARLASRARRWMRRNTASLWYTAISTALAVVWLSLSRDSVLGLVCLAGAVLCARMIFDRYRRRKR